MGLKKLIGIGLIGAALGALFAPKAGKQLRKDIEGKFKDIKEKAEDIADKIEKEIKSGE